MSDLDEIRRLIRSSGNNFHCRVVNALQAEGWATLISPYYTDSATDKPREIDLIAEKSFPLFEIPGHRKEGEIHVRLFIECKYIPQYTIFWIDAIDAQRARELVIRRTPFEENNTRTDHHHYLQNNERAAKLFYSGKDAVEHDPIYKALNQSLSALIYYRRSKPPLTGISSPKGILERVEYPVILCDSFDKFYGTTIGEESDPYRLSENFLLEINYAYVDRKSRLEKEYFLIDVVSYGTLNAYLSCLDEEVQARR